MRLYSNPKHSQVEISKIMAEIHKEQIEADTKVIKDFLLSIAIMIAVFTALAFTWSVIGN